MPKGLTTKEYDQQLRDFNQRLRDEGIEMPLATSNAFYDAFDAIQRAANDGTLMTNLKDFATTMNRAFNPEKYGQS